MIYTLLCISRAHLVCEKSDSYRLRPLVGGSPGGSTAVASPMGMCRQNPTNMGCKVGSTRIGLTGQRVHNLALQYNRDSFGVADQGWPSRASPMATSLVVGIDRPRHGLAV